MAAGERPGGGPRVPASRGDGKKPRRRRVPSACSPGLLPPDEAFARPRILTELRDSSPTIRICRDSAQRFACTYDAFRRGLNRAQRSSTDAKGRFLEYLTYLKHQHNATTSLGKERVKAFRPAAEPISNDVNKLARELVGKKDSQKFAAGVLAYGLLLFIAGSMPWLLPFCYVVFALICLPWRALDFVRQKWTFFLLDFCYWANVATIVYFLAGSTSGHLEAAMFALTDGPLAAALIVWQSAWVFGSAAHSISVLIHLLPGLALFSRKHCGAPVGAKATVLRILHALVPERWPGGAAYAPRIGQPKGALGSLFWLLAVPLLFYIMWQLVYFLIVQVALRRFIQGNGYDTSYNCLARRAAKSNNFWNRLVRRGSIARRVAMYGLVQATFTVGVLLLFIPIYHSYHLSLLWQVVKVAFPVYHGAKYACEKVPRHIILRVLKAQRAAALAEAQQAQQAQRALFPLPDKATADKLIMPDCDARA